MRTVFVCLFIVAASFNVISSAEDIDKQYQGNNIIERLIGRSYSLTQCNSKLQLGYSCLSCNRALHCYMGNTAIIIDCYGLFRYCRDGRCSRYQGEKCAENKVTTPGPFNTTTETDTDNVATSEATKVVTDVTEAVLTLTTIGEKASTESDSSASVTLSDEKATTKSESTATVNVPNEKTTTKSDSSSNVTPVDGKATTKSDVSTTTVTTVDISSNVV